MAELGHCTDDGEQTRRRALLLLLLTPDPERGQETGDGPVVALEFGHQPTLTESHWQERRGSLVQSCSSSMSVPIQGRVFQRHLRPSLADVRVFLGHASVNTTSIYLASGE